MPACLLACLLVCHVCLLACLHQEPGKNSLRALVSEALELPPDLGGKAVGAGDPGISTFMTVAVVDGPVLKLGEGLATHVLQNYGRHIDALEARIKDPRLVCAQRMSMARRITRLRRGAKNTVKQAAHEYALLIALQGVLPAALQGERDGGRLATGEEGDAEDAEHLPRGVPEPSRPEGGPVRLSGDLGEFVCLLVRLFGNVCLFIVLPTMSAHW